VSATRIVIAAGGAGWESEAIATVEARADLRLVRRCVDVADVLATVDSESADVIVLSPSLPGLDLDVADRLRRSGLGLVVMREGDADAARRLDLGEATTIEELRRRSFVAPAVAEVAPAAHGRIIAVWGPTGAPGRSSVALSLASAWAARAVETILVDADVEGGALAQAVGLLDDVSGLVAASRAANAGHGSQIVDHAVTVGPHLRLLTGLPRADMADQVRPAAYEAVLSALTADAEVVVVDCGFSLDAEQRGRGEVTVATLVRADEIVLVGRSDPLGLARLVRAVHDLGQAVPGRVPHVLLNHARPTLGWNRRDVDATVHRLCGIAPEVHLPWDQQAWDAAVLAGRSPREAAPSSPYVARVEAFVSTLAAERVHAT